MKSSIPELLPRQIDALINSVNQKNSLLRKSREEQRLGKNIYQVIDKMNQSEAICKSIQNGFNILKSDFTKGEINQAVYIDHLKSFERLFTSNVEHHDIKGLNSLEILQQLLTYLPSDADVTNQYIRFIDDYVKKQQTNKDVVQAPVVKMPTPLLLDKKERSHLTKAIQKSDIVKAFKKCADEIGYTIDKGLRNLNQHIYDRKSKPVRG